MEKVRPGTGRETGLGHAEPEPTGTYSQHRRERPHVLRAARRV